LFFTSFPTQRLRVTATVTVAALLPQVALPSVARFTVAHNFFLRFLAHI